MKRVAIILISFLLIHGGVAWALAKCLRHHDHSDQLSLEHGSHSRGAASVDVTPVPDAPFFHCPLLDLQIGVVAQSGSTQLRRDSKFASVQAPFFYLPYSVTLTDNLWLEAVFRGIFSFFSSNNLNRHLYLSVLRI